MNSIMKNHKSYCMDMIHHHPHGYRDFGGLVREERRVERCGGIDRVEHGRKVVVWFS